jgi:hypothetical protein
LVRLPHHSQRLGVIGDLVNLLHSIDPPLLWSMNEHRYDTGTSPEDLGRSAPDDDRDVIVNNLSDQSILDSNELALVKNRRRRRNITGIERADSVQGTQALEPRIRRLSVFL